LTSSELSSSSEPEEETLPFFFGSAFAAGFLTGVSDSSESSSSDELGDLGLAAGFLAYTSAFLGYTLTAPFFGG